MDLLTDIYYGQTDFGNRSCKYDGSKKELEAHDKLQMNKKKSLKSFYRFVMTDTLLSKKMLSSVA